MELSRRERLRMRIEHGLDRRSVPAAVWLLRRTGGRMARLWGRRALVLNVRGRRSGRNRSVPLQYFPDGETVVLVAANSGLPRRPAWYFNLLADEDPSIEIGGRRLRVRVEELETREAEDFWPRVLEQAPDYSRYAERAGRRPPLLRVAPRDEPGRPGPSAQRP